MGRGEDQQGKNSALQIVKKAKAENEFLKATEIILCTIYAKPNRQNSNFLMLTVTF